MQTEPHKTIIIIPPKIAEIGAKALLALKNGSKSRVEGYAKQKPDRFGSINDHTPSLNALSTVSVSPSVTVTVACLSMKLSYGLQLR
jgi:hypothetical protein